MKLVNTYKNLEGDWYSWTVSIEGTSEELSQVKHVTYQLHETFPNPRLVSTDAANNFARTATGWGEFLVRAEAVMKSGEKKHAKLWLDLGFEHTRNEKEIYTGEFENTE